MLKLYNTLTRKLEVFKPKEEGKVKVVTCGPSIYQLPHIGNYRTFMFEDVLQRYLEYLGYDVQRLINITDVEDKTLVEASKQKVPPNELTQKNIEIFLDELKQLKIKIPDFIERSSTSVNQAVELIKILLEKGYAYWYTYKGRKNVYYDPLKFDGFGKLYGLDMSKWPKQHRRFHRDNYSGDRWNKGDFILWRGYKKGDTLFWETKLGKGHPAWNIQDQAMVKKTFGFNVDIWCSGIDSTHRHHDYIIATVESIIDRSFVNYWLHCSHLIFDGEKMSKRKGNIKYPKDLIETECIWNNIRFFLIYGHYRRKLNFTFTEYSKTCDLLNNFRGMVEKLRVTQNSKQKSCATTKKLVTKIKTNFEKHMNNDLHVKTAFNSLYITVSQMVQLNEKNLVSAEDSKKALANLKAIDSVLRVIF
ncbi:MAG: class I tRNA ligase family protein [Candidatus Bathyarchaeota archaeon]|nr:MAG: class I tRNA ligase family protein [Candidatus Bathyarchaeota archaeon]